MFVSIRSPRGSSPKDSSRPAMGRLGHNVSCSPFCPNEHQSNEPKPQEFVAIPHRMPVPSVEIFPHQVNPLFLLLARLLLLHHLLDNLLLLNQEGTDDPVADAVAASGTTVGSLDGLLGLRDPSILARAEGGDLDDNACQLLVSCSC